MKKETNVITKKSLAKISSKLKLCSAMLLILCMVSGCHNTDKQEETEGYSTTVPKQQNQTEIVTETPSTEPKQTEEVPETPDTEAEIATEEPSVEPVQTEENINPSKQPTASEKTKDTNQAESTKQTKDLNGKITDKALGFSIQFSEELSGKIKYTSDLKRKDDDFGMELHYTEFYTKLEEKKQALFTIYRIDQKMTEAEIEDINPEMGYLGCSNTATYTIEYTTEPKSGLSRESEQEFENLMGEAVGKIAETFQIIE